jgi:hypothetical protein
MKGFLNFLLADGRIQIRIQFRIQEAQKLMDPADRIQTTGSLLLFLTQNLTIGSLSLLATVI